MATITTYHLGGYKPAAPAQNRAEVYDSAAGTYTAWDTTGTQISQRALTTDEAAQLAAQDAATTASSNQATGQQLGRAALTANANDRAQDATIQSGAATITGTTGTLTLTQCSTFIRQLAQAVSLLAGNDVNTKRELSYLVQNMLNDWTNAPS